METEPLATLLFVRILITLAVGRLCQILLKGFKVHELADLAWLLALVLCISTGLQLIKEVVSAFTSFFQPVLDFMSWFTKDPDGSKRSWWDWLNTYPKGRP